MTPHPLDDLDDDLRDHLSRETEDNIGRGMSPEAARSAALRTLGNRTRIQQDARAVWIPVWLDQCRQDARYAVRTLVRSRVYTATAASTLALGIAASTVMFGVLNAVMLQPLPYPSPERLVTIWTGLPGESTRGRAAWLTVEAWRSGDSLSDLVAIDSGSVTLTFDDGAEKATVARVTPAFFPMLGVRPARGRAFSDSDVASGASVALISDRLWMERFGGAHAAVGSSIVVDGRPAEVLGVLPAALDLVGVEDVVDVIVPHTAAPDWQASRVARGAGPWSVVGRLRPGIAVGAAEAEMAAITRAMDEASPPALRVGGATVVPMYTHVVGERARITLLLLTGAGLCVLLIATANITSLALARSLDRAREIALRTSIGATPSRIARQLLVESLVLSAVSGVLGTVLSAGALGLIRTFGPHNIARLDQARLDLPVLGWALVLTLCTGILIGLAPAAAVWRSDLRSAALEGGRSVSGGAAHRALRRGLVVAEFAIAVALLVGAGLLLRSWSLLMDVDPGFDTRGVLSLQLSTTAFATPAQRAAFYADVLARVEAVPGVEKVGVMSDLFVSSVSDRTYTVETATGLESRRVQMRMDEASDSAFATIGTPVLRGRAFQPADRADAPPVAIVNASMARRLWGDEDPVGKRARLGPPDSENQWFTVVGVIGDMRRQGLDAEPIPQMFEPVAQNPSRLATLLVRTSGTAPLMLSRSVQTAIRRVDPRVPIYGVTTLDARLGRDQVLRRFQTAVLSGLSLVALVMAAIGIYGLMLHSVLSRTMEIGIRLALGARATDIFRMTMREGLQLSLAGLVLGLVGAAWLARAIRGLLFGVTDRDPVTVLAVVVALGAVAAVSCLAPARRAMTIDPNVVLHHS